MVWKVGDAPVPRRRRRRARSPSCRTDAPRRRRGPAGHRRSPGVVGRAVRRRARSTPSTSTPPPGWPRWSRPTSAAARGLVVGSPTRTASSSGPGRRAWTAVFGFYTPSLRTTELIPGQVRLLRSLLDGREATVDRVILASDTDGTYIPKRDPASEPEPVTDAHVRVAAPSPASGSLGQTCRSEGDVGVLLPLLGLLVGVLAGLVLNVNVSFELSRYSAVGDPRGARLGPRGGPGGARRGLRQSDLHQRVPRQRDRRGPPHVHRRSARPGPVPRSAHHLRASDLQQRGAHPAPLPLDQSAERSKTAGGTRSGPRRHRRRHEQGLRAHRRGEPRRPADDHGPRHRARVRPQEGRRHQHRPDRPLHRRRGRAGRAPVRLEDRPRLRRRRRPARREPQLVAARSRSRPTTARSPARTSTAPSRSPGPCPSRRTARSSTSSGAGFTVDGQEGVKDPLGMSALRLEVETHIVTRVRDRGPEPDQVRRPRPASRSTSSSPTRWPPPRPSCPRRRRNSASPSPTSAPARSTSRCSRTARRSTPASCRSAAATSPTTSRSASRRASRSPRN